MNLDNKLSQNDPSKEKIKFILELFNSNKLADSENEIKTQLREEIFDISMGDNNI